MPPELHQELRHWLQAFLSDPGVAFGMADYDIYALLVKHELLDLNSRVTEAGLAFLSSGGGGG